MDSGCYLPGPSFPYHSGLFPRVRSTCRVSDPGVVTTVMRCSFHSIIAGGTVGWAGQASGVVIVRLGVSRQHGGVYPYIAFIWSYAVARVLLR